MTQRLFPHRIETARLRFEPLHESVETLDFYEYHRSGDLNTVMQHLSQQTYETPKQARDRLETTATWWDEGMRAEYAMYPKAGEDGAGEFAGVATLMPEWEKRLCYFGLWLREAYWGRGYAGERAAAMFYVCFERFDFDLVGAGHVPGNDQSRRAIRKYTERYGGQYDGLLRNWIPEDGGPRDLHTYSVLREQWRNAVSDAEVASISVCR